MWEEVGTPHEFRRGVFALTRQEGASILRRAMPGLAPLRAAEACAGLGTAVPSLIHTSEEFHER